MNADMETFLSQHRPTGTLSITSCSQTSDGLTLQVGQRFDGVDKFKDALRSHAIRNNFDFTFIKNDRLRSTVRCASPDCQWRVHASKEKNDETFRVKTMQATHTCGGGGHRNDSPPES